MNCISIHCPNAPFYMEMNIFPKTHLCFKLSSNLNNEFAEMPVRIENNTFQEKCFQI